LSDREAQLALRDEIENGIDSAGNDEFESSNGKYTKGSRGTIRIMMKNSS